MSEDQNTYDENTAHLYRFGVIDRCLNLIRERGLWFFVRKAATVAGRMLYASTLLRFRRPGTFIWRGKTFRYFCHPYNFTWDNERAVEIPIALDLIEQFRGGRVLEIGNVLSHYVTQEWDVVDKFERCEGIVCGDAVTYCPPQPADLILSISTLEHVGFDDDVRDPTLIPQAIENLRGNSLAPGGRLMATVPIGYNPDLDWRLFAGELGESAVWFLKRTARYEWREATADEVRDTGYATDYIEAGALAIIEFTPYVSPEHHEGAETV